MTISAPTDIANLSLWLQAEQGAYNDAGTTLATTGQTVQQWNDLSGNSRNASQATAGSRPSYITGVLNGKPVLRFGSKSLATTSFLGVGYNTAITVFVVAKSTTTNLQVALAASSSKLYIGQDATSPTNYTNDLSNKRGRVLLGINTPNAWRVQTLRYDGANRTDRVNGIGRIKAATGNLGITGAMTVGALSGTSSSWSGDIAEVIVYNAALTDLQISDVEEFLNNRYALTTQTGPQVIFDGDSITFGYNVATPYPTTAMASISARWVNLGVNGETVEDMNANRADQIEAAYCDNVINIASCFGGTNDLFYGADAATTLTRLQTWHGALKALGYKTIAWTILPRSGVGVPVDFETQRQSLNTSIRANTGGWYDELCDVAADSRIGDAGDETDSTYYQTDTTHPKAAGHLILAEAVAAIIPGMIDSTIPVPTSAAISTNGLSLVIEYTEADSTPLLPATGVTGYTLSATSGAVTVTGGTISGTTVTLTLSRTIHDNETVTYSYSQDTGNVTDSSSNEIANQTDSAVTNNSEVAPSITSVAVDAIVLVGTPSTITWSSSGTSSLVDILIDGVAIVSGTANDGSYSWTPEASQLGTGKTIRVRDAANSAYYGEDSTIVATSEATGGGTNTALWFRLQELAVNDGLELLRP